MKMFLKRTTEIAPVLGVPVVFDAGYDGISDSRGLWRWKTIVVGRQFISFPSREQQAILLHEAAHCRLRHLEKRLLNLWRIFRPAALAALCVEQEYEADRFAAHLGYGVDLARAFSRVVPSPSPFHPPVNERIERLLRVPAS